ncbi:hypothetical protein [Achromobacter aegrifaciens]|uniref:hypothetical protein n=1 Tax=Achromobacter aegrifaciens TaxID=1287736 RepID=UPI0032085D2F
MDWKKLLKDISAAGYSQARIATELGGKPQSWVSDITRGRYADLKWTDGQKLIQLHKRVLKAAARQSATQ